MYMRQQLGDSILVQEEADTHHISCLEEVEWKRELLACPNRSYLIIPLGFTPR